MICKRTICKPAVVWCLMAVAGLVYSRAVAEGPGSDARDRLENLSAAEKQELDRKRERFQSLSTVEQQQLRRLHQELHSCPDGEQLRQIMQRYALWLRELSAGQRAELLDLPPESRLQQIKLLLQNQENRRMRHYATRDLSDEDLAVIVRWMEDYVAEHEEEILAKLPDLRAGWESVDVRRRRQMLIHAVRTGRARDVVRPDEEDIQRIKHRLSSVAQQEVVQAQQDGQLAELAERWMRAAMISRRSAPEVPREELQRFYAEMDARGREYFESLPPDRMESELKRWYHFRRFLDTQRPPFGRPGEGPRGRPGRRPGGGDERLPGPFGPPRDPSRDPPRDPSRDAPRDGRPPDGRRPGTGSS